jgi:hypothetical protein
MVRACTTFPIAQAITGADPAIQHHPTGTLPASARLRARRPVFAVFMIVATDLLPAASPGGHVIETACKPDAKRSLHSHQRRNGSITTGTCRAQALPRRIQSHSVVKRHRRRHADGQHQRHEKMLQLFSNRCVEHQRSVWPTKPPLLFWPWSLTCPCIRIPPRSPPRSPYSQFPW